MAVAIGNFLQKKVDYLKEVMDASMEKNFCDEYESIVDCNSLWDEIDNEIFINYNFIRDTYRLKFPELESLVPDPVEYARVVKKIGNETEISSINFEGLLFPAIIVAVSITSSNTTGTQLPDDVLQKTMEWCDLVLSLDATKTQLLGLLTTQMGYIAPNLSAVVGIFVAAKLVASAGGLSKLVNMDSCVVQCLGVQRQNLAGFSRKLGDGGGYVQESSIFQSTPPSLKMRVSRLLANKSIIAARIDFVGNHPTGNMGKMIEEEIQKNINKWQELPPAKRSKPLPVPVFETTKKQRGGRRLRKRKERYSMTEVRKLANRMAFGIVSEESYSSFGV